MRVIGVPDDEVWRVVAQVALDGKHPLRRKVLSVLIDRGDVMSTASIAGRCALPQTSVCGGTSRT
jgi:NADP-dependent 3-hydroxy acid dehydrogenase YdfG